MFASIARKWFACETSASSACAAAADATPPREKPVGDSLIVKRRFEAYRKVGWSEQVAQMFARAY